MSLIPPQTPNSPVQPVPTTTAPPNPDVPLSSKLESAATAAPKLSPDAVVGIASTASTANEAANNAQNAHALTVAYQMVDYMNNQSTDWQAHFWNKAPHSLQALLAQAGYKVPDPSTIASGAVQGGFWHDLLHVVTTPPAQGVAQNVRNALGDNPNNPANIVLNNDIGRFLGSAKHLALKVATSKYNPIADVGRLLGSAFNAAGAPISHLERAAARNTQLQLQSISQKTYEDVGANPLSPSVIGQRLEGLLGIVNPVDINNNWASTADGASSFQPNTINYVINNLGITGPTLQLAKLVASVGGADNVATALTVALKSVPKNDQQSAAQLIMSNPKFMDGVRALSNGHLSPGQMLMGGISPKQLNEMQPGTSTAADTGARAALDVAGAAGAGALLASGGGAAAGAAAGEATLTAAALSPAELALTGRAGAGVLDSLGTLRGAASAAMPAGAALGNVLAGSGKTPDQATAMSPFGLKVNPLSGMIDATLTFYQNPIYVGLAYSSAYKGALNSLTTLTGAGSGDAVARGIMNIPSRYRWAQQFAQAAAKPWVEKSGVEGTTANFAALRSVGNPDAIYMKDIIDKALPAIKEDIAKGADGTGGAAPVAEMMRGNQAIINLFSGRAGGFFGDSLSFPTVTPLGKVIEDFKGLGSKAMEGRRINVAKLSPRQLSTLMVGEDATNAAIDATKADEMGLGTKIGRRLTTIVNTGPIDVTNPAHVEKVMNAALMSLPRDVAETAYNGYLAIPEGDIGAKQTFLRDLKYDIYKYMGLEQTTSGQQYIALQMDREKYGPAVGASWVNPHNPLGPRNNYALLDTQLSNQIAMPDWREVYQFSKKGWVMSTLQNTVNRKGFDWFMSHYWKRALLLRPGFGVRVAGEEVLSYILRHGPAAYAQGFAARSLFNAGDARAEIAAQSAAAEKEVALHSGGATAINNQDSARMWHALASHIPHAVDTSVMTPDQLLASVAGWHAIQWAHDAGSDARLRDQLANVIATVGRKFALSITPDEILAGAHEMTKRGVLKGAYSDLIDSVSQHSNVFFGDIPDKNDVMALLHGQPGVAISMKRSGVMVQHARETPEALTDWIWQLGLLGDSNVAKDVAKAFKEGGADAQYQAAMDWITGVKEKSALQDALATKVEENIAAKRRALAAHERLVKRFSVHFQDKNNGFVATGAATQEQSNHDWAQGIVDMVNHLTMTTEGQTFRLEDGRIVNYLKKGQEGERIPVEGPQPIRLGTTTTPRVPLRIGTFDEGHFIEPTDAKQPYHSIPAGNVRLFRAHNSTTLQENLPKLDNPGRTWFANYQDAANRAGADGEVYHVTVPVADLAKKFEAKGVSNPNIEALMEAQGAGKRGKALGVSTHESFLSSKITYTQESENSPNLLIDRIAAGSVPGFDEMKRIERIHMPDDIAAPEMIGKISKGLHPGSWSEKTMETVVGRPLNYLARQPIAVRNYAVSWAHAKEMLSARGITDTGGDLAHQIAMDRAIEMTIPFIHQPQLKSQFSVLVRNIAPFWFAQEQFYKRWGRLFGTYPEAWYKLSQTITGLQHVGFIYTDAYGQQAYAYPGSPQVVAAIQRITGSQITADVGLGGEINQLNPTTSLGGMPIPAMSPIVTVPMAFAGAMFPQFEPLAQGVEGPTAPQLDRSGEWINQTIQQLTPSFLNRMYDWSTSPNGGTASSPGNAQTQIGSALFMSSSLAAMQYMELNAMGQSLANARDPAKQQQYMDQIANWTKTIVLLRSLFGLIAPATPMFKFNNTLGAQYEALLAAMPYSEAQAAFLKAHPNATADEIFTSTTSGPDQSGAYIPATQAAGDYIKSNSSFFDNYSQIAPWTIPLADAKGLFNGTVYQQEFGFDMRTRRNLQSMYEQIKYAEGANIYYPLEQQIQAAESSTNAISLTAQKTLGITQAQALANIGMPGASEAQVKQVWDKWKAQFLYTHPVFQQTYITEGTNSSSRRAAVVQQLSDAISAGALPAGKWATQIEELMFNYDKVTSYYTQTQADTSLASQRKANAQAFLAWGTQYAASHPDVAPFWNGVLAKSVPS